MKTVIFVVGGILLLVAALIYGPALLGKESQSASGRIEIVDPIFNAGTISMAAGLVEHTFEIKNIGEGDFKIKEIYTSCMCTTARLEVNGKESPEFGMHTNSLLWSEIIPAGETARLKVVFDPVFHGPTGTGQMARVVYLKTNILGQERAQAVMNINVVQ